MSDPNAIWGSVTVLVGILLSLGMTLSLYLPRRHQFTGVLALYLFGFVLGTGLARLLHWYFNPEMYAGFGEAFSDPTVGAYMLPGMLVGVGLAAWITEKLRLAPSARELLDCAAPGTALLIAALRLSALWDDSCRGLMQVSRAFRKLPFGTPLTDAAGNVRWVFATFAVAACLMLLVSALVYLHCRRPIIPRIRMGTGEVARWTLLLYGAVEIVMDSTRYDSPLMHFRFLTDLNQYSAFISLAQVFAGVCALAVLVAYSVRSIRANGFKIWHAAAWLLFALSLFGIGKLGEYDVQRYASYGRSYTAMILSLALMLGSIYALFRSCPEKSRGESGKV